MRELGCIIYDRNNNWHFSPRGHKLPVIVLRGRRLERNALDVLSHGLSLGHQAVGFHGRSQLVALLLPFGLLGGGRCRLSTARITPSAASEWAW